MTPAPKGREIGVGDLLGFALKLLLAAIAIAIPLLGVWAGSSLAAYANGPKVVALMAGALAFPIAPLAWDAVSEVRRRGKTDKRILTFFDRFILRTLAINVVFLGIFLASAPELVFTALSTRGDWMLDDVAGSTAGRWRAHFLNAADGLAWLYELAHDNPYEKADEDAGGEAPPPPPAPVAEDTPDDDATRIAEDEVAASTGVDDADEGSQPAPPPAPIPIAPSTAGLSIERPWPSEPAIHPAVRDMPESEQTSVERVARWVQAHEPDPLMRVKALHDFVADHVAYDVDVLHAIEAGGDIGDSQDPDVVLRTGKAVCMGYSLLLEALGKITGDDIRYVVGDAHQEGHAWNAAQIDGRFLLIDATWDAGYVNGGVFTKRYSTDYLFTPAVVFGVEHFPDEPGWQLRSEPLSRGEFNRQPQLKPSFFARGYRLNDPNRARVEIDGPLRLEVAVPQGHRALIWFMPSGSDDSTHCGVVESGAHALTCNFPGAGVFEVHIGDGDDRGYFESIGSIEATYR